MSLSALGEQLFMALGRLAWARLSRERTFACNMLLTELLLQCDQPWVKLLDTVEAVRERLPELARGLRPLLTEQCATGKLANEMRLCPDLTPIARAKYKAGEVSAIHMRQCVKEAEALVLRQEVQCDDDDSTSSSSWNEEAGDASDDGESSSSSGEQPTKEKKCKQASKKKKRGDSGGKDKTVKKAKSGK